MHDKTDLQLFQEKCARADSLQKLYTLAVGESLKFSDGCGIVFGPISTGGRGKIEENIRVFEATIRALQQQGMPIFSQIPYEDQISLLCRQWRDSDPSRAGKYYMPVLDEFYGPLIQTGLIKQSWFIPGWESSYGAKWERKRLEVIGADIHDLSSEWIDKILHAICSSSK